MLDKRASALEVIFRPPTTHSVWVAGSQGIEDFLSQHQQRHSPECDGLVVLQWAPLLPEDIVSFGSGDLAYTVGHFDDHPRGAHASPHRRRMASRPSTRRFTQPPISARLTDIVEGPTRANRTLAVSLRGLRSAAPGFYLTIFGFEHSCAAMAAR